MRESDIQKQISIAVSELGARVARVNTGQAWVGKAIHLEDGSILLKAPRPLIPVVGPGGQPFVGVSDLIGLMPVKITADMVGQTLGVFTAIEVKTATGAKRKEQELFVQKIRALGGFAGFARSAPEAQAIITGGLFASKKEE